MELAAILNQVAREFGQDPVGASFAALGQGRIHRTVLATGRDGPRRVYQRLNTRVFPDPRTVMANVRRVGAHLRGRLRPPEVALEPLTTAAGGTLAEDPEGGLWRCYPFIDGTPLPAGAPPPRVVAAARAYGGFVAALADLPAPPLAATLPGFHDTPARLGALERALSGAGGDREARALARDLLRREATAHLVAAPLGRGELPQRVTHNDTKLDNILVHRTTGAPLCVVDLDTVMPGTPLHDFGDLVRSACAVGGEDGDGPLELDLERFAAAARGYLEGCGGLLTAAETALLAAAPRVITLELAARFLTDHLAGDPYFPVTRRGENLHRARRQARLLASMEHHGSAMESIVSALS